MLFIVWLQRCSSGCSSPAASFSISLWPYKPLFLKPSKPRYSGLLLMISSLCSLDVPSSHSLSLFQFHKLCRNRAEHHISDESLDSMSRALSCLDPSTQDPSVWSELWHVTMENISKQIVFHELRNFLNAEYFEQCFHCCVAWKQTMCWIIWARSLEEVLFVWFFSLFVLSWVQSTLAGSRNILAGRLLFELSKINRL